MGEHMGFTEQILQGSDQIIGKGIHATNIGFLHGCKALAVKISLPKSLHPLFWVVFYE
jgi:hypothetical protein